jgi:dienelactone hydrolase
VSTQTEVTDVVLMQGDVPLALRFHRPAGSGTTRLPTVVCLGSWLTVKEQMADLYAERLARAGLTAVTFDFSGFGASGGRLRQTEMPTRKIADLGTVVDFLRTLSTVDADRIGVLGVCASAQYVLGALARGLGVASFVAVAGWFHDLDSVAPFYGGAGGVASRLARSSEASRTLLSSGTAPSVPAYAARDERAGMFIEMDYYANPTRGAVPSWVNEMSELSWFGWLTYDAFAAAASGNRVPTLLVHSEAAVLPDNVRRVAALLGEDVASTRWLDGEQTDFYDQPAQVEAATDLALEHFAAMGR